MRLLLDTCTFIWLTSEPERLSATATAALDEPRNELLISDVSALEICLKWTAGKLSLPAPPRTWVEEQARVWALERLVIGRNHLYRASELPDHHRDPFDRLLVAQSLEEGVAIVTPDTHVKRYPVAVVW